MLITHLGHSGVLVETDGARLLIDPGTMSTFEQLTDLDAVLITHQHPDHLDPARVGALLAANPGARLVMDPDTATAVTAVTEWPAAQVVVRPGDRLSFGGTSVESTGGLHAVVYGDFPGCTNSAYLIDDGAFLHPGDSYFVPAGPVDVLAVPVVGPWVKLSESIDYLHAVAPRAAFGIHDGDCLDPAKYAAALARFSPDTKVTRPEAAVPTTF